MLTSFIQHTTVDNILLVTYLYYEHIHGTILIVRYPSNVTSIIDHSSIFLKDCFSSYMRRRLWYIR
jgi:hypothetical protein